MTAMKTPSSTNTIHLPTDRLIEPITPSGEGRAACADARAREASPRSFRQICTLRTAPLRASTFAAGALPVQKVRKAKGSEMEKNNIEQLRALVGCAAVLEHEGFAIENATGT
jgi:hypothetical protein